MTKMEKFALIAKVFEGTASFSQEDANEIIAFCETEQANMIKKNAKAAERAKAKRIANDNLLPYVKSVLSGDWMTKEQVADAVAAAVEGVEELAELEITASKMVSRLKKLVDAGEVVKTHKKTEDTKRAVVYALADAVDTDEDAE